MIPKVIHKVVIVDDGTIPKLPDGMKRAFETWYRMNPGYRVKIYSGKDCVAYIKEHFDNEILEAYNALKPYSYKCDFMRHLIMYQEGGWYSDMRQECLLPIENLEKLGKEYYTSVDCPPNQICMYTAFIGSVPKHPISKKMIDLLLWNVSQKHYGLDCLYPTGPGAYMNAAIDYVRAYPEKCMIGQHTIEEQREEFIRFNNVRHVKCKYNNAKGADNTDMKGTNDYGDMWRKRDVYLTE
jgi:mannosyltransferase OCH1-like enzyme